ncbi:MAG TPA: Rrf2 family transcriptional regulator [Proteobacteria bacterium]|nr:HTH-type transcriptional regulator IscR [bacterium BMS3Abin14]HDL52663.1 Rrf2 family transcriptional regulator [Pseudomonadota bacterium]
MKITTRASYTVRALLDLAQNSENGRPVRLSDISLREGISHAYLEQLFNQLKRVGVVKGKKGPGGGYVLSLPLGEILMGNVIRAVEGDEKLFLCTEETVGEDSCRRYSYCTTHHLWERLSSRVHEFLNSITLADLLRDAGYPGKGEERRNAENLS